MKIDIKHFALAAAGATMLLTSCIGDLDTLPLNPSDSTSETVYGKDENGYLAGLTKLYFNFVSNDTTDLQVSDGGASELIRAFWTIQEVTADACKCAWENDAWVRAMNTDTWSDADNDATYAVYVRTLQGIAYVNEYLRQTASDKLSDRGVSSELAARIGTDFEKFYSAPATVRMTVTTAERTYPQVWVIGDYCGWNFDNAQGLFCFSGDEVTYEAIVDLGEKAANGFKLSGEAGWNDACNWGTDGDAAAPETEAPSITLISSGGSGNIMVYSKRFYRFVFDRSTLTLSNKLSFNSMGIIGDATPGGWDTDTEMNFDTQKQRFWVDVTLTAGEFKFRADNDWAINFGGADGRLSQNGDNIKATAGNYRVYATLNNSAEITYELNAGDYGTGGGEEPDPGPEKADWYIHGQTVATPDWGPTAMESASSNIVAYKAAGVEVAANSEFLFKSGDESQWIGADAAFAGSSPYTCTIGSAFKVSADKVNAVIAEAGTYDYWLLPEAGRAYVMAAGAKPELVADTWGLVGNITGWGDLGDFSMSEEGAYLVRKGVALTTASEFKIRFNNAWDDSKNYGTASGGAVDINKAVDIITSGGSQNMKVQLDGTYDIYFDLANSQIYIMSEGKTPAEAE